MYIRQGLTYTGNLLLGSLLDAAEYAFWGLDTEGLTLDWESVLADIGTAIPTWYLIDSLTASYVDNTLETVFRDTAPALFVNSSGSTITLYGIVLACGASSVGPDYLLGYQQFDSPIAVPPMGGTYQAASLGLGNCV